MGLTDDLAQLTEMGFSEKRARHALKVSDSNVTKALDWLIAHADAPEPESDDDDATAAASSSSAGAAAADGTQAKSFKCDDCGKALRDAAAVELHAHRTGHENFSESVEEIKPLTEEEKAAQLNKLRERLAEKRANKAREEEDEQRRRELERRKAGRQGHEIQTQFKEREELKRVEAARRQKQEDAAHLAKLRAQLEQDKIERMARMNPGSVPAAAAPAPVAAAAAPVAVTANMDESRIQVRLSDNTTLQATFKADEPLLMLRTYIMSNWSGAPADTSRLQLSTTFPRKVFSESDMGASFKALGLVPSSAVVGRVV